MGEIIKSAREISMEKIEKLGKLTQEERLKLKYVPEGEKLAAGYMKEEYNLVTKLNEYKGPEKKYIVEGATGILVRNINLPRNDSAKKSNKRAMDGLRALKTDKVAIENVFSQMRRIFDHYTSQGEQQRRQAYESLKADFIGKIQRAAQQQMGSFAKIDFDVERQPQFQEEWRRVRSQLDQQYFKLLSEMKQAILSIP